MSKRKIKGQYGYRDYHRRAQCAKVLTGAALIIIQLAARGLTDQQMIKNFLTIMAILSVLPVANLAAPLLAGWRYRTPPKDFYQSVASYESKCQIIYDLIVTSKSQIMPMDAVAVHSGGIYAYCSNRKLDGAKAEAFLNDMLDQHKQSLRARVIQDETAFLRRLDNLRADCGQDESVAYCAALLRQLSM